MSSANVEDVKENIEHHDDTIKNQAGDEDQFMEDLKDTEKDEENRMPSVEQEEECIKNKYGGMIPKKKPLINMDHERAFFDSADWALGKQGAQKPKGPLEALLPKLQPTPHQQVRSRRSAYAPAEDFDDGSSNQASFEDDNCISEGGNDRNTAPEYHSSHG